MKSSEHWLKVGKSGKKLEKVVKSGKKWGKKWGKVAKSGEKWRKVGKVEKVGKSWKKWAAILVFRFSPKSIGFFHSRSSMAVSNMNLIRVLVSQLRETQAFSSYFHKMAVGGHFDFPIFSKIDRVLPL